jgi:hypothetical protein
MQTIPVIESSIAAATVFRSGALVTRVARLELDAVPPHVRITGLPLSLDDASVRVQVEHPNGGGAPPVTASGLKVCLEAETSSETRAAPDDEELERARRDQARLQDRIEQVGREMDRLKRLKVASRPASSWSAEGQPCRATPGDARLELVTFQHAELEHLLDELRRLREERRRATEVLAELEARAQRASSARDARQHELRKSVVVSLSGGGEGPVAARLRLEYRVPGARWAPSYALHLDRSRGSGPTTTLACRAMVCQRTGEDWNDVALTVTTADPQDWCELPELESVRIGRWQPPLKRPGYTAPPVGAEALFSDHDRFLASASARPGSAELDGDEPTVTIRRETVQRALAEAETWDDDHAVTCEIPLAQAQALVARAAPVPRAAPMPGAPAAIPAPQAPHPPVQGHPAPFGSASELPGPEYLGEDEGVATLGAPVDAPLFLASPEAGVRAAKSAGLFARFSAPRGRRPQAPAPQVEDLGRAAVAPPETPSEPPLRPQDELLAYDNLYLPPLDHARRGLLTVRTRQDVSLALLVRQEVEVTVDLAELEREVRARAQAVASMDAPPGHVHPSAERGFVHAYPAEAPVSVASDGSFHSVPLSIRKGESEIRHVTVPRVSQDVFRVLELRNPLDAPLLEGPADLYVDGDYLLTTSIHQTAPRGELRVGLGVEPAIKVSRNTTFSEEARGLIKGMRSLEHGIRIELANQLGGPATVEVRERLPQARKEDDEIEVEVKRVEPPWTAWEQDDRPLRGGYRWTVDIDAGERRVLEVDYGIRIAAKYELVGGNRREA